MHTALIVAFTAKDTPGIVDALSKTIREYEGNWVDSHLSHLCGLFTGILHLEVESNRRGTLINALEQTANQYQLKLLIDEGETSPSKPLRSAKISLVGNDKPGLINEVAHALALHRINVRTLESSRTSAPMSGSALFNATINIDVSDEEALQKVQTELERIADDLMIDIQFES